ncbi:hypothetical protein Nepgr_020886 [Nepenthes gracilis]|uniref:Protein kinase domain-containing protein n=1 Tax=Nepenthes gracilis TaxID=150966 RepID=A0AAD3SXN2_NEPGR|nr:hypothetical protein Nepgr_020886 [Nepenthes gracilis]
MWGFLLTGRLASRIYLMDGAQGWRQVFNEQFCRFNSAYAIAWKNRDVIEPWELDIGPQRFPYGELVKATTGFRDEDLLGFGGSGRVYGVFKQPNTPVAIKRIFMNLSKVRIKHQVREARFKCKHNKGCGHDGLPGFGADQDWEATHVALLMCLHSVLCC